MKKENLLHKLFWIAIFIKGVDGILESVGGLLLLFLRPRTINTVIILLTSHELTEDPRDLIANYLRIIAQNLSIPQEHFAAFFLLIHGIANILIVIGLFKDKIWTFRVALSFLSLFIVYQVYRLSLRFSLGLLTLIIFDIILVLLILHEHKSKSLSHT